MISFLSTHLLRSFSYAIFGITLGLVVAPDFFSPFSPLIEVGKPLRAPSWSHLLGTDELGRDLYARIVHGAFYSITTACLAIVIGVLVGGFLGIMAALLKGWSDIIIMRLIDILLAIPSLLLSFSIITLIGIGQGSLAIAVGASMIASFARLTRTQILAIVHTDYVEAAHGSGATLFKILIRHILPNGLPLILSYAILQFGYALLQIATLGFLGFGVAPPLPEWGILIAEGRGFIATAWWLTLMPGLAVIIVVVACNHLGRALLQHQHKNFER